MSPTRRATATGSLEAAETAKEERSVPKLDDRATRAKHKGRTAIQPMQAAQRVYPAPPRAQAAPGKASSRPRSNSSDV